MLNIPVPRSGDAPAPLSHRDEVRFAAMIEFSGDAIISRNLEGVITSWNPAAEKMLGYTALECIGNRMSGLVPHDRVAEEAEICGRIARGETIGHFETIRIRKDGKRIDISTRMSPIRDADGKIIGTSKFAQDITERKRSEESLRLSEIRYRRLFETAQDGILILDARTGQVVDANPFMQDLLGYSLEEFEGKKLWEIGPFKGIEASKTAFAELQEQDRIRYEGLSLEAKHGRRVEVEFVSNAYLVDGKRVIQCNIRDMTARKTTEESLRLSEIRYRRLFETAQDGILILDANTGQVLDANPFMRDLLGYSLEEFVGKKLWEIGPFKGVEASKTAFAELQEKDRIRYESLPLEAKDGRRVEVEFVSNAYLVDQNRVIQCNIRDMTARKTAEESLRLSEIRYRRLFETAQDGILILNANTGQVLDANPFMRDLLGYSLEEFVGKKLWEIGPFKGVEASKTAFGELQEKDRIRYEGLPLEAKDGRRVEVEFVSNAYLVDGKRVIQCNIRDMTARKTAEESLRLSESRYRRLFETAQDGILILNANTGQVLDANPFMRDLLGYSLEEFVGKKLWEIGPFKGVEASKTAFAELQEKDRIRYEGLPLEAKDGRRVEVEFVSNAYLVDQNRVIQCNIRDMTARKTAEESLRLSEIRYRRLFETAQDGILILDANTGQVVDANPFMRDLLGYSLEEFVGKKLWEIGPFKGVEASKTAFAELQEKNRIRYEGLPLEAKDGRRVEVEFVSNAYLADLRRVIQCNIRDITTRKNLERHAEEKTAELARSNAELGQFAYVASHDLQEPLRAVTSCVQLLKKRYEGQLDARAHEFISHAVEGTTRMETLIDDLLAYSRVGTQAKPFEPTICESVLKSALLNLEVAIQESNATITHSGLPTINADPTQLGQVFQNLIGNAIKFRGEQPPVIRIGAVYQDGWWTFTVADNGIGIEPQYFDRIFRVFQRLHTRKQYRGTGIGLAICKKVVERHGGRIWIESVAGQGATFYFTLPDGR